MAKTLCSSCSYSIWCPTWSEWKCKKHETRMHSAVESCNDYSVRPIAPILAFKNNPLNAFKDNPFNSPLCQCKDCLVNEIILDEMDEGMDGE